MRTRKLLKLLSVRECAIPRIHVAGTNGKGSTCAYLQSLFTEHGYKVGGFISPHLVTMRERFLIDRKPVDKRTFARAFQNGRTAAFGTSWINLVTRHWQRSLPPNCWNTAT